MHPPSPIRDYLAEDASDAERAAAAERVCVHLRSGATSVLQLVHALTCWNAALLRSLPRRRSACRIGSSARIMPSGASARGSSVRSEVAHAFLSPHACLSLVFAS